MSVLVVCRACRQCQVCAGLLANELPTSMGPAFQSCFGPCPDKISDKKTDKLSVMRMKVSFVCVLVCCKTSR